jgi:hypothetical protein
MLFLRRQEFLGFEEYVSELEPDAPLLTAPPEPVGAERHDSPGRPFDVKNGTVVREGCDFLRMTKRPKASSGVERVLRDVGGSASLRRLASIAEMPDPTLRDAAEQLGRSGVVVRSSGLYSLAAAPLADEEARALFTLIVRSRPSGLSSAERARTAHVPA